MVPENRMNSHPISIIDYLQRQAARCRHFAQRVQHYDLQEQLIELAEEFERRAEEISKEQGFEGR